MDDSALDSLKSKIVFGSTDPSELNRENGVIISLNFAGGVNLGDLRPGQYVRIGDKWLKICGVVEKQYCTYMTSNKMPLMGIVTTNKVFSEFSNKQACLVGLKMKNGADSNAIYQDLKSRASGVKNVVVENDHDSAAMNNKITLIGNVFILGFIAVIALIGVLNIINTMSTNVLVRTREIGLLRAGGMTMGQVGAMVGAESALYGILALIIGAAAGIPLEHEFFEQTVTQIYSIPWGIPWNLVIIAALITLLATCVSIISPLKRIKAIVITESITMD